MKKALAYLMSIFRKMTAEEVRYHVFKEANELSTTHKEAAQFHHELALFYAGLAKQSTQSTRITSSALQ